MEDLVRSRGQRLREARKLAGLTQEALAEKAECSKAMVAQWETGVRRPGVDTLHKLSIVLNAPFSWLAIGEGVSAPIANGEPGSVSRQGGSLYNSPLLLACSEMVLGFFIKNKHEVPLDAPHLSGLIDELYTHAASQGWDLDSKSKEEFTNSLQGKIRLTLS